MEFFRQDLDDVIVLTVNLKRATLVEAEEFKQVLVNEIQRGFKKIVVDLSTCEFIDSTFLGSLVVSLKKLTGLGGDLRLVGFQPAVHSMFELTRMYRVFESFKSSDEAVQSFK
ncbi:MAG: STAS domain-containing protein [Ignavibacteriaceae bacterium]|jgi:anti-anti-sigma factor|nr:STAS domain-containing protein [Ignavibacterium sp.]MCC6254209.1 STAS domain-containing protein [Ignavibacteriaceae bacterium]HMN24863.1 STAS domain-containing protein [Ignavibacteriaceae bacterium]HRN25828.1 STAS domain-containing protein [Ignavibacteriaceae bacterium]HRP91423.1 STAS domain-containing protein [Ignavibacteriaceae bacterium]